MSSRPFSIENHNAITMSLSHDEITRLSRMSIDDCTWKFFEGSQSRTRTHPLLNVSATLSYRSTASNVSLSLVAKAFSPIPLHHLSYTARTFSASLAL